MVPSLHGIASGKRMPAASDDAKAWRQAFADPDNQLFLAKLQVVCQDVTRRM
jgi:hypothetical protein